MEDPPLSTTFWEELVVAWDANVVRRWRIMTMARERRTAPGTRRCVSSMHRVFHEKNTTPSPYLQLYISENDAETHFVLQDRQSLRLLHSPRLIRSFLSLSRKRCAERENVPSIHAFENTTLRGIKGRDILYVCNKVHQRGGPSSCLENAKAQSNPHVCL